MEIGVISSFRSNCGIGLYTFQFLKCLLGYKNVREVHLLTHIDSDLLLPSRKLKIYKIIDERYPFYVPKMLDLVMKIKPDVIEIEWDHSLYSPTELLGTYIFPLLLYLREKTFISFHSLYRIEDVEHSITKITGNKLLGEVGSKYYSFTKLFLLNNLNIGRVFTLYEHEQVKKIKKKFVLIPHGIDKIKSMSKVRKDATTLTIFGFIRKTKDYELAIKSLSFLPKNFRLVIAGQPVEKGLVDKIKKWIKQYKVRNRVVFIPKFLSSREKERLMEKSDILLLPYLLISTSGVLLDCIKYCRPVVSTVLQEDISHLKIGLYSKSEAEEFAEAIFAVKSRYEDFLENISGSTKIFMEKYNTANIRKLSKDCKQVIE